MSDDLAFRFNNQSWSEWPLTVDKYEGWINTALSDAPLVNLFMDYETFGEHQWADTGIFDFFADFVQRWLSTSGNTFYTVSEAINANAPVGALSTPHTTTWADEERDLSAWLGNSMQHEAMRHLYALEKDVLRSEDASLIHDWRALQSSDHTYYMSTKFAADGDVHAYFSPYDSPYDAFLYFINAVRDIRWRLHETHKAGGLSG